jgi:16S rRNA (guanine527-N7)-methyltransferase
MADEKRISDILRDRAATLGLKFAADVYDRIPLLYELHIRYRKRAGLSAEMDVYGYVGEFLLDLFELEAAGKLINTGEWCDVGSGGGYPGLPLAIIKPGSSFTLLEPSRKKAEYLRIAIDELGLSNSVIVEKRVEDNSGEFDAVTCKGLTFGFVDLTRFLRPGGKAYIFRESVEPAGAEIEVFSHENPWNGKRRCITIIAK